MRKAILIGLLLSTLIVGIVSGAVLWSLLVPMKFKCSVAMGLELEVEGVKPTTSIDWGSFNRDETKTLNCRLFNVGNQPAKVKMILGTLDPAWSFSSTWVDTEIPIGSSVAFDISLTEVDAIGDLEYTCDLSFDIVDFFEPIEVSFGTSSIEYLLATSSYLQFVTEGFDKSTYPLGTPVVYSFTTKSIQTTGTLEGFIYSLYLYSGSIELSTIVFKETCDCSLAFGETITLTKTFNAPITYMENLHLLLRYEAADYLPPPPPPEYTYEVQYVDAPDIIWDKTKTVVTGMSAPNQASSIYIFLHNNRSDPRKGQWDIEIFKDGTLVQTIVQDDVYTFGSQANWSETYNFNAPSAYGHYVIKLTVVQI